MLLSGSPADLWASAPPCACVSHMKHTGTNGPGEPVCKHRGCPAQAGQPLTSSPGYLCFAGGLRDGLSPRGVSAAG